jgi:NADH-quinone oxidoreductase subunit J
MEAVVFYVFSAVVLAGAIGVVVLRHPVYAALSLVATMVAIAVLFLAQDADLVAIVQIVVYASAITVLFLFVIMLLGVDQPETGPDPRRFQRAGALLLGTILAVEVLVLAGREWAIGRAPGDAPLDDAQGGNVRAVAEVLFTDYLWAVQVVSVMLVIAVVGAVVLARRSRQIAARRERTSVSA